MSHPNELEEIIKLHKYDIDRVAKELADDFRLKDEARMMHAAKERDRRVE